MSLLVKIIGLDRRGFRIKASGGHYRTVTSAEAVQVDVQDAQVQKVLKRNAYRVFAADPATSTYLT
jgi:hypothetical protein